MLSLTHVLRFSLQHMLSLFSFPCHHRSLLDNGSSNECSSVSKFMFTLDDYWLESPPVLLTTFEPCHDWLSKSESKSRYDCWSVGQSVLVSSPILVLRQDLCYCQVVAVSLMWGAPSDERTCLLFTVVDWLGRVRAIVTLLLVVCHQSVRHCTKPLETDGQRFFFSELNTCSHSPYVTSSLTRGWVCLLRIEFTFVKCTYGTYSMLLSYLSYATMVA
jgi:hypothetical protein